MQQMSLLLYVYVNSYSCVYISTRQCRCALLFWSSVSV